MPHNTGSFALKKEKSLEQFGQTYMDDMVKNLIENGVTRSQIEKLMEFIHAEEYDSEALKCDLLDVYNDAKKCNMLLHTNDSNCCFHLHRYLTFTSISMISFQVGLIFFYWPWYKNAKETSDGN
eukprot:111666_1